VSSTAAAASAAEHQQQSISISSNDQQRCMVHRRTAQQLQDATCPQFIQHAEQPPQQNAHWFLSNPTSRKCCCCFSPQQYCHSILRPLNYPTSTTLLPGTAAAAAHLLDEYEALEGISTRKPQPAHHSTAQHLLGSAGAARSTAACGAEVSAYTRGYCMYCGQRRGPWSSARLWVHAWDNPA